ncbi:MAG: alginate O-acetyltransferase [Acidobacteriota bacterium]
MVFSSYLFLFGFLPAALALYFAAPARARNLVLTLVSYVFYGWTHPAFCLLLLFSTTIDWICGLVLAGVSPFAPGPDPDPLPVGGPRTRRQRVALVVSITSNLSLLGFFKYFDFAVGSWNGIADALGLDAATIETALRVTLPLGISFYTFQSMSYAIDVWRGHARPMKSFVDFACFVSMFPQLVAGPIVRFSEVSEQLRSRRHDLARAARGVAFVAVGLAKKVLLANPCGKIADTVFDAASSSALDAWTGLVAYSFQIYFDFSGYSDMAIGLGLFLGFVFPKNFDSPYRARSITEFWRRWHLSLSTFLRDYLYVPLGGSLRGTRRTYVNLAVVMLLGGLWHGASWNFVLWGAIHGGLLAFERAVGVERLYGRLPDALRTAVTFLWVTLAWVPFRAPDFATTLGYYARLIGLDAPSPEAALLGGLLGTPYLVGSLAAAAVVVWGAPPAWTWTRTLTPARALASLALLFATVAALATQKFNPFIYFIF